MTSGSRLENISLPRSVGGFHNVRAYFGIFQAPSYYSPGPPRQWGERCPGWFLKMLLSDVFIWQRRLLLWSDKVDGIASPLYRPTTHSCLLKGQGLPVRHRLVLSRWWSVMFVGGKEASQGVIISWRFCPHWYMSMEYRVVKWVLTRR
jgi:hypothetical protein